MLGPSGSGSEVDARHRAEVEAILNEIIDPCSAAAGLPLGLVEMGIVDRVQVTSGEVEVMLLPTSFACVFVGLFEGEVRARLERLEWCTAVDVHVWDGDDIWDETRLSKDAKARLDGRRRELRGSTRRKAFGGATADR
jgi:metal-sulfur cluster biosynthetic enzyme